MKEDGQALVGGLILSLIVLLFASYFLYASESFFRLFSNAEKANSEIVVQTSTYANILNEISINNQNILAAITVSQNAFLKAYEYGLYVGFHQPYWETYSALKKQSSLSAGLSQDSQSSIEKVFGSYSLTTARGFFIAGALAEKNNVLLKKLPIKIRQYFIQSSNAQVNCFALAAESKYYTSPGILNLPIITKKMYHFYLQQETKNHCAIEHKISTLNKFIEYSLPVLFSSEKDFILDYSQLGNSLTEHYGILYVDYKQRINFINSVQFTTKNKVSDYENGFSIIEKFLSKTKFFSELPLGEDKKLLKSPLKNNFMITHPLIYPYNQAPRFRVVDDESNEQFLKAFFTPNWAVTGIYQ